MFILPTSIKARLIDDWHNAWRFISVRSMALAAGLSLAWAGIPADLRALAPSWLSTAVLVVLLVIGAAGAVIKQDIPHDHPSDPQ